MCYRICGTRYIYIYSIYRVSSYVVFYVVQMFNLNVDIKTVVCCLKS